MTSNDWIWFALLPLMAIYATWRAVTLFKRGRLGFAIALVFLGLFCVYEMIWQIIGVTHAGPS